MQRGGGPIFPPRTPPKSLPNCILQPHPWVHRETQPMEEKRQS